MDDIKISREMIIKIKETFDCSLMCSSLLMTAMLVSKQNMGIKLSDLLNMQKNYCEINEFLEKALRGEENE